jgi:hypothetical protein
MFQNNTDPSQEQTGQGYRDVLKSALNLLQVNDGIKSAVTSSAENLTKMDREMSTLVKSMGVTSQYSQLLKQDLGRAVTEVALMGGKQSDINVLQKEFLESTNRTIVLSTENIENLYAVSQVSGVAVKTLETAFRNAGMETTHISEEMKTVYHTANSLGVNAQAVSSMVVANLDKMNRFGFGNGIEGMAKMAAKAASMRVDMNQTLNLADKLFSPEAAMDVAATLQRLGATSGALLDPLKLMDLAQNNVPELQNQLSELSKTFTKFDEKTGKFQIMPEARRQLGEVASALGIDRSEFEKMALESAKMEKKLGEINFRPLGNISEDEKMMIANLAEFNKAKGDYTVKFTSADGKVLEKTLGDLTEADKEALKNQQNLVEPQKELVDIAKEQLGAANTLLAQNASYQATIATQFAISNDGNNFLKEAVKSQAEILKPANETFSLKTENKNLDTAVGSVFKLFEQVINGTITDVGTLETSLNNILTGTFGTFGELITQQENLAKNDTVKSAMSAFLLGLDLAESTAKNFGVNLEEVATSGKKALDVLTLGLSLLKVELGGGEKKSNEQTVNPQAATNGGVPNSNSNSNNNNITPPPTPLPANNNTSQVREIKHTIELTVKAETNNPEVNTAVLKALDNDDTLRVLRENIAKVASDYGLTAV